MQSVLIEREKERERESRLTGCMILYKHRIYWHSETQKNSIESWANSFLYDKGKFKKV